jgi:hypothetical protein
MLGIPDKSQIALGKHWRGIQARGQEVSAGRSEPLLARSAAAKQG